MRASRARRRWTWTPSTSRPSTRRKGLEWPLVFVPCLTDKRFPSSMNGRARDWRISTDLFDRTRYEGTTNDERRLFYVAATRARDFLSLSTFHALSKTQKPSRFLTEIHSGCSLPYSTGSQIRRPTRRRAAPTTRSRSPSRSWRSTTRCGVQYRLRSLIGFQPPLVARARLRQGRPPLLRQVAEHVRTYGKKPTPKQLEQAVRRRLLSPGREQGRRIGR